METYSHIASFINEYENYLLCVERSPAPCSTEEVSDFESMLSHPYKFPGAYKEFLLYSGRSMPGIFSDLDFSCAMAKILLANNYEDISIMLEGEGCDDPLPSDIFVITERLGGLFYFLRLGIDENPPVYLWEENCGGGLEAASKEYDSFSCFLMDNLRIAWIHLNSKILRARLEANQPHRGTQIWYATKKEQTEGISLKMLKDYFGFAMWRLEEFAQKYDLSPAQYLEELSGWEAKKLGSEIRFFPPSN